jgi:anti-sigma28 factor (negative regulator of flagellin synthesis)
MTRDQAKAQGLARYIGDECKRGHFERYVSTNGCCECMRLWKNERTGTLEARAKNKKDKEARKEKRGTAQTQKYVVDQAETKRLASKSRSFWTQEDTRALKQMITDGESRYEIAMKLGRSRSAINRRVEVLGIGKPEEKSL